MSLEEKKRNIFGERHPYAKLDSKKVLSIRKLSQDGVSQKRLAKMFGVHKSSVQDILKGIAWKHVKQETKP